MVDQSIGLFTYPIGTGLYHPFDPTDDQQRAFVNQIIDVCSRTIITDKKSSREKEQWKEVLEDEFLEFDFDDPEDSYYEKKNSMVSHLCNVSNPAKCEELIHNIAYFCIDQHHAIPLTAVKLLSSHDSLEPLKQFVAELYQDIPHFHDPLSPMQFAKPFVEIRGKALIEQNWKVSDIIDEYNSLCSRFKLPEIAINILTSLTLEKKGQALINEGKSCQEIIDELGLNYEFNLTPLYELFINHFGKQDLLDGKKTWQYVTKDFPESSKEVASSIKDMHLLKHGIDHYINKPESRAELFEYYEINTLKTKNSFYLAVVKQIVSREVEQLASKKGPGCINCESIASTYQIFSAAALEKLDKQAIAHFADGLIKDKKKNPTVDSVALSLGLTQLKSLELLEMRFVELIIKPQITKETSKEQKDKLLSEINITDHLATKTVEKWYEYKYVPNTPPPWMSPGAARMYDKKPTSLNTR
ncbi:hypothetical protein SJI19_10815 [Acerihabitans sp. TG2]|uniref:hypothetical protein n=1 Tax=Acerihabitans sp. TG2 TaxID=3096008 RepID=UPI002B22F239|nr:hypothetical protein [Acerihabitans sp. TG2]MEA9391028.1 hypothetical protein [Acerihabitans sp. TG2]